MTEIMNDGDTRQWTTIQTWNEPETGYKCEIKRCYNSSPYAKFCREHYCGYVTFKSAEPVKNFEYDHFDVMVHGGVTYVYNQNDGYVKVGFDTAHLCDQDENGMSRHTVGYVIEQTESLAQQLKEYESDE